MTLRRLLFVHSVPTMAAVERYIATDNPANFEAAHGSLALAATVEADRAQPDFLRRSARDVLVAGAQLRAIRARVAATNYFAPSTWAVSDAATSEADPSPSLRTFLATRNPAPVSAFIHYADVDRARGYLTAGLLATPEAFAAARTPAEQNDVALGPWRALAGYFRALGMRPWALARLRARWETQIGQWYNEFVSCPMIGAAINTHSTGGVDPPGEMSGILFARRPTPLDLSTYETAAGAWRNEAFARMRGHFSAGDLTNPRRVRFGCRRDVDRTTPGRGPCALIGIERGATGCTGPTGDVHRIWLTNAAELGGGVNLTDPAVIADLFDGFDCVPRSLVDGRVDGPAPIIGGPAGFNGVCGAVGKPVGTAETIARGVILDFAARYNYFLPPQLWYFLLARSLLLYLATRDPVEVVYEAALDVLGKNTWTLISCRQDIAGAVAEGFISGELQAAGLRAGVQRLVGIASTGVGVVSLFNPLAGAGLDSLARGFGAIAAQANISENFRLDVFGRVEPCLDGLSLTGVSRAVDSSQAAIYQPPPSPFERGYAGDALLLPSSTPRPVLAPATPLAGAEGPGVAVGVPTQPRPSAPGLGLTALINAVDPVAVRNPPLETSIPFILAALPGMPAAPTPEPKPIASPPPPPPASISTAAWVAGGVVVVGTAVATAVWWDDIIHALKPSEE